jgi:hypothetical protein
LDTLATSPASSPVHMFQKTNDVRGAISDDRPYRDFMDR